MRYEIDTALDLRPTTEKKYYISSAHRKRQKDKSMWLITVDTEVECFLFSEVNMWIEESTAWGLIQNGRSLLILGQNDLEEPLKIAKFVAKNNDGLWHGYPADYRRKFQDRPGMGILQDWRTRGHIAKHHILKIRQGKECNL